MLGKIIASLGAAISTTMLASGCAVGPDFVVPAPPDVGRYTFAGRALIDPSTAAHSLWSG
jgi:hypothetical protein